MFGVNGVRVGYIASILSKSGVYTLNLTIKVIDIPIHLHPCDCNQGLGDACMQLFFNQILKSSKFKSEGGSG